LKGDNQKRMILPKNLKIEINIDSSWKKKHEKFKSGPKFDLYRLFLWKKKKPIQKPRQKLTEICSAGLPIRRSRLPP
jgi:hypothetical protein